MTNFSWTWQVKQEQLLRLYISVPLLPHGWYISEAICPKSTSLPQKSLLSHPYNKVGLSQSVWRISGEGLKELATPFPCFSDFNLPRERSVFCGQRVHLPELGRGDAKHLLRRHRGGAVDGGWCACLTISDSLSCFLANITQGNCMQCECEVCYCVHVWLILFFFSTSHQGCRREDRLCSLASVSSSLRVEADVCVTHTNCQDQQVHVYCSTRRCWSLASLLKRKKNPFFFL